METALTGEGIPIDAPKAKRTRKKKDEAETTPVEAAPEGPAEAVVVEAPEASSLTMVEPPSDPPAQPIIISQTTTQPTSDAVADGKILLAQLDQIATKANPEPADEEITLATKIALGELYLVQDKLEEAIEDYEERKADASSAKKRVETLQEDFLKAVKHVRNLKDASRPDPVKYPLLDKHTRPLTLEEVAAKFPKPEAIPPRPKPAMDEEEFFRLRRRDTRLEDIGLTPKVTEILAGAGYNTIGDLDKVFAMEAGLRVIKCAAGTITSDRGDKIIDAVAHHAAIWRKEWEQLKASAEAAEVVVAEVVEVVEVVVAEAQPPVATEETPVPEAKAESESPDATS